MTARRPLGPVYRPEPNDEGDDDMTTITPDLLRRWHYLRDGAELGAHLTVLARQGTMDQLAAALQTMTREQVEAAAFAMVLVHAEGANIADPSE